MIATLMTTVVPAVFGAFLRIWAEERKDAAERRKFELAAMTQSNAILETQRERVTGSTFLQFMVMLMTFTALMVFAVFPMIAVMWDVPLFITLEYYKETGFLFWKGTMAVKELIPVHGLYLPEDFHLIIQGAVSLIFGNVTAGMGRR